jgi:CRISPR-associated endonuclease/helicase Cas3
MVVVDEFHLASIKQSDMLLFMMHEIHDDIRSRLSKFVFLSATPNNDIVQRAKDVGLRVHVLEDKSSQSSFSEGWPVLPKLNMEVRSGSIYKTYELIKEDIDYFIEFCRRPTQEGNSAKTVFILDGIYEVDEIFNILSENLPDLNIERVDGLHHVTAQKLDNFDVLVSNSSVEVGIDFDVDRLVFSGYSKSKFLQRIGRLRNKPEDMVCDALCFVPENVYGHLKGEKKDLTRQELVTHLDRVMESSVNLSSYSKIYSPLEAYLYCKSRVEGEPWTDKNGNEHHFKGMPYSIQKEESLRILGLIEKHFLDQEINLQVVDHLKTESYSMKEGLLTYRGSGLQVLMFDTTDSMLKTYDLMYVLRRGKVEFMSPQRFIRRLRKETGENYESLRARYESMKAFASGFCWYNGTMNDETRKVILKGESGSHYSKLMFKSTDHVRKPRLVSGFKVETEPTIPTLSNLNDTLSQFNVFARLVDQDGFSLKAKFRLGDFFYLYPYYGMRSVAFGHEALYIDCLIKEEYKNRR